VDGVVSGPLEMIVKEGPFVPFVIEAGDITPLFLTDRGYSDAELREFVFDGPEIPQVPLGGSFIYLALALALLIRARLA
jgi:hypothetical protein